LGKSAGAVAPESFARAAVLKIEPARWAVLSPLMDEALALPPGKLDAWLQALRVRDHQSAEELQPLLQAQAAAASSGFLEPRVGQEIGAYKLLRLLGEGGMGRVWLGQRSDGRFDGQFAIKLLQAAASNAGFAERFRREGSMLARLSHPNIARLVDAGLTDQGEPYLVLEYVAGQRIDEACDAQSMTVRERVELFLQVLQATAHAHANLVIHRDLKPANVLLSADGRVKLLDFGIARLIDNAEGTSSSAVADLTADNGPMLTPRYAAPERWLGAAPSTASDIWSLGTCLYELLTGRPATGRDNAVTAPASISALSPPKASQVVASDADKGRAEQQRLARLRGTTPLALAKALQGDLDAILQRAMAIEPGQRYATAAAMHDDLVRHLRGDVVSARDATWGYRARRFVRRHQIGLVAGLAGLAIIAGLGITSAWQWQQARQARDLAIDRLRVAEAVRAFSSELLGVSGPHGRSLSVEETVDHAEAMARKLYSQDPEVLAELLLLIGAKNALLQRVPERERALKDALRSAQQSRSEPLKAQAACSVVPMEAEDAAAQVLAIAQQLPAQAEFARARYRCHSYLATLLAWQGQPAQAKQHALASEQALADTGPLQNTLIAEVHETRADVARAAGDFVQADTHYAHAHEALQTTGRGATLNAALLLNYRVVMQAALGRPREGLALAREVKQLLAGMSAAEAMPAYMHTNEGSMLFELGRWQEAEDALRLAVQRGMATGSLAYLAGARGKLAELMLRRGQVAEAEPLLASYQAYAAERPSAQGMARLHAASLALAKGQAEQALAHVDVAIQAFKNNPFQRSSLGNAWLLRGQIQRTLGQPTQALASVEQAMGVIRSLVPSGLRSVHLARAHLLHAQTLPTESDAAQVAARRAAEEFAATVDADHPDAALARQSAGK
jgi:eukaryotic-like serine/threonine-protein kinase